MSAIANTFDYHPPRNLKVPRTHNYFNFQQHHYYQQYLAWQIKSTDPTLRQSNYWADAWETNGKWL